MASLAPPCLRFDLVPADWRPELAYTANRTQQYRVDQRRIAVERIHTQGRLTSLLLASLST